MSMVIAHNMAALSALNTLSGNTKSLTKALKQTSSGQRINSAGDDASGYAISEKCGRSFVVSIRIKAMCKTLSA